MHGQNHIKFLMTFVGDLSLNHVKNSRNAYSRVEYLNASCRRIDDDFNFTKCDI